MLCHAPPAFLQALTSGGGKSEAFASALATAVGKDGCNSVFNVLSQAQASAESSGKGQVRPYCSSTAVAGHQAAHCSTTNLGPLSVRALECNCFCSRLW
jgi:hypothetical protein